MKKNVVFWIYISIIIVSAIAFLAIIITALIKKDITDAIASIIPFFTALSVSVPLILKSIKEKK